MSAAFARFMRVRGVMMFLVALVLSPAIAAIPPPMQVPKACLLTKSEVSDLLGVAIRKVELVPPNACAYLSKDDDIANPPLSIVVFTSAFQRIWMAGEAKRMQSSREALTKVCPQCSQGALLDLSKPRNARDRYAEQHEKLRNYSHDLSGVGDEAFVWTNHEVFVLKGNTTFEITVIIAKHIDDELFMRLGNLAARSLK